MRPTEDSGFEFVFAEKIRFTASDCASNRDGLFSNVSHDSLYGPSHCLVLTNNLHFGCVHCCLLCFILGMLAFIIIWLAALTR